MFRFCVVSINPGFVASGDDAAEEFWITTNSRLKIQANVEPLVSLFLAEEPGHKFGSVAC